MIAVLEAAPLSRPRFVPAPIRQRALTVPEVSRHARARPAAIAANGNPSQSYQLAKRAIDVAGAIVLITLLAPIMFVVFVLLTITTGGHPLFFQERVGHRGRRFWMIKFRTMCLDAKRRQHEVVNEQEGPIFKNRCDPRVTRIGALLRKTSLDETPQLLNVLAGEMSLVGPRPSLEDEVRQYEPWQTPRLNVKPGLTCLWQVSGRSDIGFDDWVRMDLWYVKNQSLSTDLMLLAKTPLTVLSCQGAY